MQASPTKVAKELGIPRPGIQEFQDAVVYILEDKIVQTDFRNYRPDKPFHQTAFLNFKGDKAKYKVFSRAEAVFEVEEKTTGKIRNLYLSPLN